MKPIVLRTERDDSKEIRDRLSKFGDTPPMKFRESFEEFCINVKNMPYMEEKTSY